MRAGDRAAVARLVQAAAEALAADDEARAEELAAEAVARADRAGDAASAVTARVQLCLATLRLGNPGAAARHAAAALAAARVSGDPRASAHARVASARVLRQVGDYESALAELDAVPDGGQPDGGQLDGDQPDDPGFRFAYCNLYGGVVTSAGRPREAIAWYERARREAQQAGLVGESAMAAVNLAALWIEVGAIERAVGDEDAAREAWLRGVAANDALLRELEGMDLPSTRNRGFALVNRAECLELLGRDEEAFEGYRQVQRERPPLPLAVELDLPVRLARVLVRRGDLDGAWAVVEAGAAAAARAGQAEATAQLHLAGSAVAEARGDLSAALTLFKRYHRGRAALAEEQEQQRAQVLAMRLGSERVLAEARAERERAHELAAANRDLADRTERLARDATLDPLTGLSNRRHLDAHLAVAHASARSRQVPLCVAMIDVDHFKRVNDHYSHAIGDEVLRVLAGLLAEHCRPRDLIARFGGEEFVLVVGEVGVKRAFAVCERLRTEIAGHDWAALAPELSVTVSIGVADTAAHRDPDAGLHRVDELLYEAKRAGRNRVVAG